MLLTSAFKWICALTKDLFVTSERPIFLIINHTYNEDVTNHVCRILTFLGANVVVLEDFCPNEFYNAEIFDAVIKINKKPREIELSLTKSNKKTYKKSFLKSSFFNKMSYI